MILMDCKSPIENIYTLIEIMTNLNILEITVILILAETVFLVLLYMELICGFRGIILGVILTGIFMLVFWIFWKYVEIIFLCLSFIPFLAFVYIVFGAIFSGEEE